MCLAQLVSLQQQQALGLHLAGVTATQTAAVASHLAARWAGYKEIEVFTERSKDMQEMEEVREGDIFQVFCLYRHR